MNQKTLDSVLKTLGDLIEIPSLLGEASIGTPFGAENARVLDYMLRLGEQMGFRTKNVDGYAGHLEYGEGEEILGVLCHLDVVPAGSDWKYPPYKLTIEDGVLYGRGVVDNKGSAAICLHALKELVDEGFKPSKRIRLIFGLNEEHGSSCMKYYVENEPNLPTLSFVPDSDFPLINSEKTIYRLKILVPLDECFAMNGINLNGGMRLNMVPDRAVLTVPLSSKVAGAIREKAVGAKNITVEEIDGLLTISAKGKSMHAKDPLDGENAIILLISLLEGVEGVYEPNSSLAKAIATFSNMALAQAFGVYRECEKSGETTINLGICQTSEAYLELSLDCRLPEVVNHREVYDAVSKKLGVKDIEILQHIKGLFIDENSTLVRTLLDIYSRLTGAVDPKPLYTGGGTYARELENAVAFGPTFEKQATNVHEPNEFVTIENLKKSYDIYKEAIRELSK